MTSSPNFRVRMLANGKVRMQYENAADNRLNIITYFSDEKGRGRQGLQEIRPEYRWIAARHVDDSSIGFWRKMHSEGLLDEATDDLGRDVLAGP